MTKLTHQELTEKLNYDEATGVFTRKQPYKRRGASVGSVDDMGYIRITFGRGRRYRAHRLAWFYVHGRWPEHDIDHIDGNRSNNAINNLRDVPRRINLQNRKRKNPNNASSGLLGAVWSKAAQKWTSQIRVGDECRYLGLFDSATEAHKAYVRAKRKYHAGSTL